MQEKIYNFLVLAVIKKNSNLKLKKISLDTEIETLNLDSLDWAQIIFDFEERFQSKEIDESLFLNKKNLKIIDIVNILEKHI